LLKLWSGVPLNIRKYDVIALLTNVAKSAVKEKVTRVVVATLRVSGHLTSEIKHELTVLEPVVERSCTEPTLDVHDKVAAVCHLAAVS
jgi:hypothetical protein